MHGYWMVSRSSSFSTQAERSDGAEQRVFPYPLNNDVRKDWNRHSASPLQLKSQTTSWYLQQSGVGLCWRSECTFSFCTVSVPITILPCSDPAHPAVSAFSPPTSPASSLAGTSDILDPHSGEPLTYTLHCFRLKRCLPHFPKEVQFFKDRSFTSEPGNPSCLHWAEDLTSVSFPCIWKPYWLLQVTGLLRCYMSLSPHKWSVEVKELTFDIISFHYFLWPSGLWPRVLILGVKCRYNKMTQT